MTSLIQTVMLMGFLSAFSFQTSGTAVHAVMSLFELAPSAATLEDLSAWVP